MNQIILANQPVDAEETTGGWNFRGYKKGGGGGSSPVETPDTLHSISYARILDVLSEGEIAGLVNGLQSVYFDDTPLQNANGSLNFERVAIDYRAGTQHQTHIAGFPAVETSEMVDVELKYGSPWSKAITNTELSAVRVTISVPGFQHVNPNTGGIGGWWVTYNFEVSTDGGPFIPGEVLQIFGKTTSTFSRTHRIELPKASKGWTVRAVRHTLNNETSTISDKTIVQDFTQVIDGKLKHPNTALIGVRVDAKQFSNIPTRAYHLRGLIISVPSNYDPVKRTYDGTWNGTFKQAYTNNPAWVFYDVVTNGRYGLGANIDPKSVDKWGLYKIAMYCDQMVDNGYGGKEPRFTCNAYFQQSVDGYRALTDIASIFRGMVYWGSGTAVVVPDMPQEPVYIYNNSNVVNGDFTYMGTPLSQRYNVVLVSWNDPKDMYRQKVEVYEYRDDIARGRKVNKTEVSAFGCTSQGQAKRLAKWIAITSCLENQLITFSVGLDGSIAAPGQVIKIADQHRAGRRIGGRIRSATKSTIDLDSDLVVKAGDRITVVLPSGKAETRTVKVSLYQWLTADTTEWTADTTELTAGMVGLPEVVTSVTVDKPFSELPEAECTWSIESEELSTQLFRVISVTEGADNTYAISAVQHIPEKFDMIDHGIVFDPPPITVVPPRAQPAPENVRISNYSVVSQGIERINARIEWDQTEFATEYEVQWRRDKSDWVTAPRTGTLGIEIDNAYAGEYEARVRAFNAIQSSSLWANSALTKLEGAFGEPPVATSLSAEGIVFGIDLKWHFPEGRNIIDRTEVWYGKSSSFADAIKLGDYAYPQNTHTLMGLAVGAQLYFWVRLVDKNGLKGKVYPTGAGVKGVSSTDAKDILEYLAGQIAETQLSQQLLTKIESAEGAAIEVAKIVDDIAAMYTIKAQLTVDGVPYMAGIGVGVENNEGVITSQVLLAAERVAILDESSGKLVTPFVVQGGQVFINDAIIGQLTAQHIKVGSLSEISDNAGILVNGKLQGKGTNSYIDLNATGKQNVIKFGNNAMTVTADGLMTINAVNVIKTLNIAGNAVSTSVATVDASATSQSTKPGSGIANSSWMDRVPLATNVGAGDRVFVRGTLSCTLETLNQECFGALQIVRNGVVIRTYSFAKALQFINQNTPGTSYSSVVTLSAGAFDHIDVPGAGTFTYLLRIRWWDSGGNETTCTCVDSGMSLMVMRR